MTEVFLEREFDQPITRADAIAAGREGGWCLEMHRVSWNNSFLASGGHYMVCWFSAPDAESARQAMRQGGADIRRLWSGSVHEAPDGAADAVPNVMVLRSFERPVTFDELQAREEAASSCLRLHGVRFVRSFFSGDRCRMVCLYQAPDAESVRLSQRQASLPFDTVHAFQIVGLDAATASK